MQSLDSTAQLIPIDELENILYNQETFVNFIYKRGNYANKDLTEYVTAINDLMAYIINNSNNCDSETFSRINAINEKFGNKTRYNYLEYKLRTTKMVTIKMIEDILNYPTTFKKFLEFPSYSQYFGSIPLLEYLISIFDYYDYSYKSSFNLNDEVVERINTIKKVYSLELKRAHTLKKTNIKVSLSPEMEKKVLDKIDFSKSKFAIARNIYVELNKLCTYDINFASYDQSLKNKVSKSIYEKGADSINYDENEDKFEIVCTTWAQCYYSLLKKCGFNATISGNFHKFVIFDCDGTLIQADATNIITSEQDNLHLDDITRCNLGLPTAGFTCLENDKDISLAIEETDREHNYIYSSKEQLIREAANEYANTYLNDRNRSSIDDKINYLGNLVRSSNLNNLELIKYVSIVISAIFSADENNRSKIKFVSFKQDDTHHLGGIVFSYLDYDDQFKFLTIDKENGIKRYSREELVEKLNDGSIIILGKNKEIFGLESENSYGPNK